MYLLIGIMFASGFAELLSLGAVLPFLAVLTNPSRIWDQQLVQWLATLPQFSKPSQLLLPITLAFSLSSVLSAATRLANLWLNGRFAAAVGSDLRCESIIVLCISHIISIFVVIAVMLLLMSPLILIKL